MTQHFKHDHPNLSYIIFLSIIGFAFVALTIVFLFFPRTKYSELEKRELAEFPNLSEYSDKISRYPSDISQWFSDSEPYRDHFMTMSMQLRGLMGFKAGGEEGSISFKPTEATADMGITEEPAHDAEEFMEAQGNPMENEKAKAATAGTIVVGSGPKVRALMAFGAGPQGGQPFINLAKEYAAAFPDVNIYAMVIPSSSEFYLPEKASSLSKPQKPVADYIRDHIPSSIKYVDDFKYLAAHTNEDIYLRTDHHWAPLGAFYAAKAFARAAGVPFKELDSYDRKVVKNYVGSMYGYTKDIAVKNAPEDFVYHTPKGLNHKTYYTTYTTNSDRQITGASKPTEGSFFYTYNDGDGGAYCTFMGSDQRTTKVVTGTNSKRKMLLIKDSFGNALPGYLFYSFGEIHVIDFRYFPYNLKKYVKDNGITDILLGFNVFNTCSTSGMGKVSKFLTADGSFAGASSSSKSDNKTDSKKENKSESKQTKKENSGDNKEKAAAKEQSAPKPSTEKEGEEI